MRTPGPLSDATLRRTLRRWNAENADRMGGDGGRIDAGTAARVLAIVERRDAEATRRARRTA